MPESKVCENSGCDKAFGFFTKRYPCGGCPKSFCGDCTTKNHNFPTQNIFPDTRLCEACLQNCRRRDAESSAMPTNASMPDKSSIDKMLEDLIEERQIKATARDSMRSLPLAQKWMMIQAQRAEASARDNTRDDPNDWADTIASPNVSQSELERLRHVIGSQTKTWMSQFLHAGGMGSLLNAVQGDRSPAFLLPGLRCVAALLYTEVGLRHFLQLTAAIDPLVALITSGTNELRVTCLGIFAFIASADLAAGFPLVYSALTDPSRGRVPFKFLVQMLTDPALPLTVKHEVLVLANALINGPDLVEDRILTRETFTAAGLPDAIDVLKDELYRHTVHGAVASAVASATATGVVYTAGGSGDGVPPSPDAAARTRSKSIIVTGPGGAVAAPIARDRSDIYAEIQVQIDLYEAAVVEDQSESTRAGVDFSNLAAVQDYLAQHVAPKFGHYLLPVLQLFAVAPTSVGHGDLAWSSILTLTRKIVAPHTDTNSDSPPTLRELFAIAEANGRKVNANDSGAAKDAIAAVESALEEQRTKAHQLNMKLAAAQDEITTLKKDLAAARTAAASAPAAAPVGAGAPPPPADLFGPGTGSGAPPPPADLFGPGTGSGAPPPPADLFGPGTGSGAPPPPADLFGPSSGAPPPPADLFGPSGGAPPPPADLFGSGAPPPPADLFGGGAPPPPGDLFGPGPSAGGAPPPPAMDFSAPVAPPKPKLPYEKKKVKPAVKMRALHWTKVKDADVEKTMWNKINDTKVNVDASELEALFCVARPKQAVEGGDDEERPVKKAGPAGAAAKGPAVVSLIEGQRGQNVAIAISRLRPMTHQAVRDAILAMDEASLPADKVALLIQCLPTPDEVEVVTSYDGPTSELGNVEKFFLTVGSIKMVQRRLELLQYKQQFEEQHAEVSVRVETCMRVLKVVKESKHLKKILEYVLAIGNYLNGGSPKGAAYGFKVAVLAQLGNTKAVDNKTNLLHFLIKLLEKDPSKPLAGFLEEAADFAAVARIESSTLAADVGKLNAGMNKARGVLKTVKPADNDRFLPVATAFVDQAGSKVDSTVSLHGKIAEEAQAVAEMFGEEPSSFDMDAIFSLFNSFFTQLKTAQEQLVKQAAEKERQERLKAAAEARAESKAAAGGAGGAGAGAEGEEGQDALSAIAAAAAKRRAAAAANGGATPARPVSVEVDSPQPAFGPGMLRRAPAPASAPAAEGGAAEGGSAEGGLQKQVGATLRGDDPAAIMKEINARRLARVNNGTVRVFQATPRASANGGFFTSPTATPPQGTPGYGPNNSPPAPNGGGLRPRMSLRPQ